MILVAMQTLKTVEASSRHRPATTRHQPCSGLFQSKFNSAVLPHGPAGLANFYDACPGLIMLQGNMESTSFLERRSTLLTGM
jgi:hypothetical protein